MLHALLILSLIRPPLPEASSSVVELSREGEVTSAWLDNGVHILHERTSGSPRVHLYLHGGEMLESASTRGMTQASCSAWNERGSLATARSDGIELMADGENAFQRLHEALLVAPSARDLDRWKRERADRIGHEASVGGVFGGLVASSLNPDDARLRRVTRQDVERLTLDATRAWLRTHRDDAPITIAVVGDLSWRRAIELASRLPIERRERPTRRRVTVERPEGPISVMQSMEADLGVAIVMSGFYACDVEDRRAVAALERMALAIARGLDGHDAFFSVNASMEPGQTYPGTGVLYVWGIGQASRVEEMRQAIRDALLDPGEPPPLPELDDGERAMRLARLDASGLTPGDLRPVPMTPEEVRHIYETWNVESRRFDIGVVASRTSNPEAPVR